ncbi:hypothetical protein Tco_1241530, partial [Tanacetum coccineum]
MVMMTAGWWWRGGGSSGDDEGGEVIWCSGEDGGCEAAGGLAGGGAAVVMMLVTVGGWCRRCRLAVVAATGRNFGRRGWCGAGGEREEREERLGILTLKITYSCLQWCDEDLSKSSKAIMCGGMKFQEEILSQGEALKIVSYMKIVFNPTSDISDETIANPNAQIVGDDMVRVHVPREVPNFDGPEPQPLLKSPSLDEMFDDDWGLESKEVSVRKID